MDYPVWGPDVSLWQGVIDWKAVKAAGASFAFIKSSEGTFIDPRFLENWQNSKEAGIVRAPYHYVRPAVDFKKQAAFFASLVKGNELPPVIDLEDNGKLDKNALGNWVEKFVKLLEDTLGQAIAVYTAAWFMNPNMPMTNYLKDRLLWVATYTTGNAPMIPNEWILIANPKTYTWWQYTDRFILPGIKGGVDMNRYHYDLKTFNDQFKTNVLPPGPPPPPPTSGKLQVLVDQYNLRNAPVLTTASQIAKLRKGAILNYTGLDNGWYTVEGKVFKDGVIPTSEGEL